MYRKNTKVINRIRTMKFFLVENEKCNFLSKITRFLSRPRPVFLLCIKQVIILDAIILMRSNFEIKRMKRYLA